MQNAENLMYKVVQKKCTKFIAAELFNCESQSHVVFTKYSEINWKHKDRENFNTAFQFLCLVTNNQPAFKNINTGNNFKAKPQQKCGLQQAQHDRINGTTRNA